MAKSGPESQGSSLIEWTCLVKHHDKLTAEAWHAAWSILMTVGAAGSCSCADKPCIKRQHAHGHTTNTRTFSQELGELRRYHRILEAGARVASAAGQLQQRRVHGAGPQA